VEEVDHCPPAKFTSALVFVGLSHTHTHRPATSIELGRPLFITRSVCVVESSLNVQIFIPDQY